MGRMLGIVAATFAVVLPAWADSIIAEGKTYDEVYVVEGGSMYYIHFPDSGKVTGVPRGSVPRDGLRLTEDAAARKALRERWNARNDRVVGKTPAPSGASVSAAAMALQAAAMGQAPATPQLGSERVSDGAAPRVRLQNVPLGAALKGLLRPMNLDYKVEPGYIRISTPEKLRTESSEPLETRYYYPRSTAAETLPKVVVGNPAGNVAAAAQGVGGGVGGIGGVGGGVGGIGGGIGGGGAAMGMGGGGVGVGGGASFSNISQLFSTIDDRLVGEPPAVIGMGNVIVSGGGNANYAAHNGLRSTMEPRY